MVGMQRYLWGRCVWVNSLGCPSFPETAFLVPPTISQLKLVWELGKVKRLKLLPFLGMFSSWESEPLDSALLQPTMWILGPLEKHLLGLL